MFEEGVCGVVVGVEGDGEVGVAVAEEGEDAGGGAEGAEAAVGASDYADGVPQVAGAEVAGDDAGSSGEGFSLFVEPSAASDVVHLSGDDERLVLHLTNLFLGLHRPGVRRRVEVLELLRGGGISRELGEELLDGAVSLFPDPLLGDDVEDHAVPALGLGQDLRRA